MPIPDTLCNGRYCARSGDRGVTPRRGGTRKSATLSGGVAREVGYRQAKVGRGPSDSNRSARKFQPVAPVSAAGVVPPPHDDCACQRLTVERHIGNAPDLGVSRDGKSVLFLILIRVADEK